MEGIKISSFIDKYLNFYDNKDIIGKIFFLISLIVLIYMFISPINNVFINIDSRFTMTLINLPWNDFWKLIFSDVHPPLYYLILLATMNILNFLNVGFNQIFVAKIVSIIPFIILIVFSLTKIRKDYDWFTAGMFVFAIGTMSNFFIQFLTIRMYSWGLLFLILTFYYIKDVLEYSTSKSWILFTLFAVLSAYTHNILLVSVGLLYLIMLCYFVLNKKLTNRTEEIKKWFLSGISLFICYLPWLFVLIGQTTSKHSNGLHGFDISGLLSCLTSFTVFDAGLIYNIISLVFLIIMIYLLLNNSLSNNNEILNKYLVIGMSLFLSTIIIGSLVLPFVFGNMTIRYLVPIYGVLWLVISILLGNLKDKRIFTILTVLVIVLACCNFINVLYSADDLSEKGINESKILEKMNSNDSVVIYTQRFHYYCYHNDLNQTKDYSLKNLNVVYKDDCNIENSITKILKDNPKSDVYIIKNVDNKKDKNFGKNINAEVIGGRGHTNFIKLSLKEK